MKTPTFGQFTKAARRITDDQRVPYAFEKRIMAHLAGRKISDLSSALASTLWRAAFSCLLITLVTSAVVGFANPSAGELFATDLERTVLAPVDVDDTW
jgi:hypothetical protein